MEVLLVIKILRNSKKLYIFFILLLLPIMLNGCKKSKRNSDINYNNINKNHIKGFYNINIINSEQGVMKDNLLKGYEDALLDLFGKKHFKLTISDIKEDTILSDDNIKKYNLILANGELALNKAFKYANKVPIVSTGVLNFQSLLKTENTGLLNPTGLNITGTSTISPMSDVMSLIIESTKNIKAVGLLYSPEDDNAIYQNEVLESFMNEAKIPWKEYELSSSKTFSENTDDKSENQNNDRNKDTTIIEPVAPTIQSSFSNTINSFDNIGEKKLIETPFSPTSARAPKVSKDFISASENRVSILNGASNEDVLSSAISECSVLFIPAKSNLRNQINLISDLANNASIPTVTNDTYMSSKTLTSMYTDPYAFGYSAGKQTYRILIKKEKPSNMAIESISSSVSQKLYNKKLSKKYDLLFPKSFSPVETFFKETLPGSTVKRIQNIP